MNMTLRRTRGTVEKKEKGIIVVDAKVNKKIKITYHRITL